MKPPKFLCFSVIAVLLTAIPVLAAPGDTLVLRGSIVDVGTNFMIFKADNGRTYYVDMTGLDRGRLALRPGATVSISGPEGSFPNEMRARLLQADAVPDSVTITREVFAEGQWRLPRTHRYEVQEPSGRVTQVTVESVPARVDRGEWIYDRTADRWVFHPSFGRFAEYFTPVPTAVVTTDTFVYFDWQLPRANRYEWHEPSGRITEVEVQSVPLRIDRGEWIYDRTARQWVFHPSIGRNPAYLLSVPSPRVVGSIQSLEGDRLMVRTDAGQLVTVDIGRLPSSIRPSLRFGDRVVVAGEYDPDRVRFRAQSIHVESQPAALPRFR